MKRILTLLLGLVVLVLGGRALFRALASEETKIRWRLERMEAGYDEGDVGDAIGPIATDWRHEGYPNATRDQVRAGLAHRTLTQRDRETKELRHRVDIDWETLEIEVDGDRATSEFEVRFSELVNGEWIEGWHVRARCTWRHDPNGWFLHASSSEDIRGTAASL